MWQNPTTPRPSRAGTADIGTPVTPNNLRSQRERNQRQANGILNPFLLPNGGNHEYPVRFAGMDGRLAAYRPDDLQGPGVS